MPLTLDPVKIMFGITAFPLFVGSVILLTLTPGPDMAYVVGHSVAHGRRAGIVSALGVSLGGWVHTTACAFGLSALLAESATAFDVIKWIGAVYLMYLGISTLRASSRASTDGHVASLSRLSSGALLLRGFVTNVTNPKVLLFYIAFLPQFVEAGSAHKAAALFVLGSVMVALGFLGDSVLACCGAMVARSMKKRSTVTRWLNRVVGVTFVGMGIRLAAATR